MLNKGFVTGRLVREIGRFSNKDGSEKVLFTLAVQRSFKNANGERDTDYIQLEGFIPAKNKNAKTVYDSMNKGALVTVEYTVRTSTYEQNDKTIYHTALLVQQVDLLETKAAQESRTAAHQNKEEEEKDVRPIITNTTDEDDLPF